ncbi:hypothetical protein M9H77_16555 [Catharanthus roseus]|uniref:Uncharacterized protein n=1 Tax=Catharanthus roseus TaxID=4058 RepID=A0ACC0B222_CATRO|nr:hypothetical protein M9H77_16555 [Catharanthus roseus]
MGTGIPKPYPRPWRVGSGSINFIPRWYGSGFMFHYKDLGLGLGQVLTITSYVINDDTVFRSSFEYNEIEKRWIAISGLSQREAFSYERTRPIQCPRKVVAEEKEHDRYVAEGSDEEYDEFDSSI